MRSLELKPLNHEIECRAYQFDKEEGICCVDVKLQDDGLKTTGCLNASEVLKISKWFADLAKELTPKKTTKKK